MPKVFLSHSYRDKAFARKLASELSANGIDVWIDEAEIRVGDSLIKKISLAIDEADFIAVVLSSNSVNSEWVMSELKIAMTKELADKKVRVLPILKEKCEVPIFLKDKLYADFTSPDSFDAPFSQLLHALGVSKPTSYASEAPPFLERPASLEGTRYALGPAYIHQFEPKIPELEAFDDIRIVGVDKNLAYKPDDTKALYNIFLSLSSIPSSEWVEIFESERQFPRHSMWRHAWIEGGHIVIQCVPDEIGIYHLKDLKQDVQTANQRYRDYLKHIAQQEAMRKKLERDEQRRLDQSLDGLEF